MEGVEGDGDAAVAGFVEMGEGFDARASEVEVPELVGGGGREAEVGTAFGGDVYWWGISLLLKMREQEEGGYKE